MSARNGGCARNGKVRTHFGDRWGISALSERNITNIVFVISGWL